MCQNAPKPDSYTLARFVPSTTLFDAVHQLSCACAESSRHINAPMSRDLFHRIEDKGQSLVEAAEALGLGQKDCAYLLAGFRRDVASDLVALLLNVERPRPVR